jgi:hypothetical protein
LLAAADPGVAAKTDPISDAAAVTATRRIIVVTPSVYSFPMSKRFQIRPPGLKPTTKVGTLGPYRGRLGLAWVIAPIVAGLIIVVAGYLALFR